MIVPNKRPTLLNICNNIDCPVYIDISEMAQVDMSTDVGSGFPVDQENMDFL